METFKTMIIGSPPIFDFNSVDDSDYSDLDLSDEEDSICLLPDIDQRNINNPTKIARYAETIFSLAKEETHDIALQNFFESQNDITPEMHEIAIKWLFSIQSQCQMSSNSLFEAVIYLNTILTRVNIEKSKLQLMTVTCMWLAAKMEERAIPTLNDLIYICSNNYTADDFVQCERDVLRILDYRLNFPTPKFFLRRLTDAIDADSAIIEVSNFFCELSLIPLEFINYDPSTIALACICLGKLSMREFCPTKRLMSYAHIDGLEDVKSCAKLLVKYASILMTDKKHILYKKFTDEHLNKSILDMELDINIDRQL
ncbi:Cyclin, N-terminal domain containing protein [Tritrichomonas foetus]|uniref:Cyclin, N-terminal domain containing protein n=1 Tax=Tritrichomonas foetus TaxID=1144522 RepID=A0A1J4JFU7_9EUKA|nr:Cyclin, N-terminal domain containing protein [Tritrichomonas foetus]|eukprot:OHS98094.1 Cyclin, N-terminal domain containing protein [Tritrichomonas foetus]